MKLFRHRLTGVVFATVACTAASRAFVRADLVAVVGRPPIAGVTITALKEGRLHYTLPDGSEVDQPIEQVRYLQITGWDAFNEAESARNEDRFLAAADAYERLLDRLTESDARPRQTKGTLDRRLLVQCRLVQLYDAMGRFDKAVAVYLDAIETMEALLEPLRPARLPAEESTFLSPARQAVRTAIERHAGTPLAASLAHWLAGWPAVRDAPSAPSSDRLKRSPSTRVATLPGDRLRAELARVAEEFAAGRWKDALERLAPLQNASAGALRPELFYWQGRCWAEMAAAATSGQGGGQEDQEAARDRRRAGLAFMRVVIHYPRHRRVAESLWRAGELCARDGRSDLAAGLWAELVRRYPTADPWRQKAVERLEAQGTTRPATQSADR